MKHHVIWFFALALVMTAAVSGCRAEEGLAGTLAQAGIDAEALYAEAPLIGDVQIGDGVLSFSVGDLNEIYLDLYDESGESAARFSLSDFTYQDGVWTVRSEAISPELSFDIGVASEAGYGQYTSLTEEALAWVEDDTVRLSDDGTITVKTDDELEMTYGSDGRLRSYTYIDGDGLAYTYTAGGRLLAMEGYLDEIGAEVAWSADDGWYALAQTEEGDEWTRMSEEQIELALPYAKYAEARLVSWERQWYPNNTACAMGLSLRELDPGLTDKWYNILPVRIDRDGRQVFPMVASNLYIVGSLTVTVRGDWVTVTCKYFGDGDDIQNIGETVAWFTSMDQVTADYLAAPESNCRFGRRLSRRNDLNDQSAALLFVCNRVTYAQPFNDAGALLTRYWPNHPRYVKYRENLTKIMGELP